MSGITRFPGTSLPRCVGCDSEFQPRTSRQKRCNPKCRGDRTRESHDGARKKKSDAHDVEFIAVDGEGIDGYEYEEVWDDEESTFVFRRITAHQYVLLSVGDQSLHKNGEPLTHDDVFGFLYQQYLEHPSAVFVGFFLGYDFSQWFKTIHYRAAWRLLHRDGIAKRQPRPGSDMVYPFPVVVDRKWEIDILGAKRFKLRPWVPKEQRETKTVAHKDGTFSTVEIRPGWMYVNDAGAFFQTSLLNAIDPKGWPEGQAVVTDEEFRILYEGKQKRSNAKFDTDMIRYNLLENDVLSRLMSLMNSGFVKDGIKLGRNQWFGPGQAAQKWLTLVGCPTGEEIRAAVPEWARDAARESYFGGWFEIMYHGIVPGETFGYDINSAYPTRIATLPCLMHGEWTRGTGRLKPLRSGCLRLVKAEVTGTNTHIGAMPHRRKNATILRPRRTAGWYWWSELQAAKRAKLISSVKVHEWVEYRPCSCPPPLRAIAEMYEDRMRVGKDTAYGKAKKLVYNSAYGKLAQSIGQPKFSNPVWASLITSHCREMILDAIATHPNGAEDVVMVATDSVTFLTPHPTLPLSKLLGEWSPEPHTNLSLLMPGVYWDDKSRERVRNGQAPKVKSRGISARDIARNLDRLDNQWRNMLMGRGTFPKLDVPIEFAVISGKSAITRDKWWECGMVVTDGIRTLSGDPSSKRAMYVFDGKGYLFASTRRDGALVSVSPEDSGEGLWNTAYDAMFGEDMTMRLERESLNTQDGPINQLIIDSIRPD